MMNVLAGNVQQDLTLELSAPQNSQTHPNNSSPAAGDLFECV